MDSDDPMTHTTTGFRRATQARRGMTLIEVILAIVILSGAMLGLANFGRKFQHATSESSSQTLASDLAAQRLEQATVEDIGRRIGESQDADAVELLLDDHGPLFYY